MSHSEPKTGPKMTLWETRMGRITSHHITSHLGGKFPQVSHSSTIGSEAKPKLAQILCGSPDFGDPVPDATVPPRATPPYPLDTCGGLRTNFSSINPSDRASVITPMSETLAVADSSSGSIMAKSSPKAFMSTGLEVLGGSAETWAGCLAGAISTSSAPFFRSLHLSLFKD